MKVSVVILNWNGQEFLRQYLPALVKYSNLPEVEVVVADNGSTDNSREVVEREFPSVRYLQLDQNYGFAEGYNQALRQIEAEYYLLLNSDVEVTQNWLEPLVEMMDADSSIGACQPKILQTEKPEFFEYAGAAGGFIDRFGYPFCRGRLLDVVEKDGGQYDKSGEIFWGTGACLMVRSSVWKALEGLDAHFWAHMEEIDLCWRMKNRGYKVCYNHRSAVHHVGGGSLSYGNPRKIYLNFRNNLFLLYKNLPPALLVPVLLSRMVLDGVAALQFLVTGQVAAFRKVFMAHLAFYRQLSHLRTQRKQLLKHVVTQKHPQIYRGSLVWNYYFRGKKKFSELHWKR
jgi:GT2 family glycosyltransferase